MTGNTGNIQKNILRISFEMVTRPKIYLDEEKITKLIKDVFEEAFKKQEVNITNTLAVISH